MTPKPRRLAMSGYSEDKEAIKDNSRVYTGYTHYTDFQNCLITTITYRDHD
ncbi:hypothetical protein MTO96_047109, partial [Rhipicephalus appendiculatus]